MKIIVTGAAGFIGSNLSEYLLNNGHTVIGIDNFNDFYNPKVKELNIKDLTGNEKFILKRIDLLDVVQLGKIFKEEKDIDAVVHLAALPGVTKSFDTPALYVRHNIEATVNLVEMCRQYGPKNFIFASTSSVYGDGVTPFVETMTTDMPLAPYPATKKSCEVILYSYAKNFGIKTSILRIFNPNGPRLRPDLAIPKLIKSCLYGNEFSKFTGDETGRDYVYVKHILEAIETIAKNPFDYEIFNLGNSSPVLLKDLIKTVEEVVGKKANIVEKPARKGEMYLTYANVSKAEKMIGYKPNTTIKQVVEIYYEWFLKQEDWYKQLIEV
jgi:UDP-glucuronate 4-epimerase